MVSWSVVVCIAFLAAAASATEVNQCEGRSLENLSSNVQLMPCKKLPCRLKKGTRTHVNINFTARKEEEDVINHVNAEVFGLPLPFIGVDGSSICDKIFMESGEKASCPLKAGSTYTYKDSFPILSIYPSIAVKVHWALQDKDKQDIVCFEVPAEIK